MADRAIPTIDLSAAFGSDDAAQAQLVQRVRAACKSHGFFALTGHGVPQALLDEAVEQTKEFFSLPLEVKEKYAKRMCKQQPQSKDWCLTDDFPRKDLGGHNRGYEPLRAQNFEKRTEGDLKEGFYFGVDLAEDHPSVVAKKFNLGPNKYPTEVSDPARFKEVMDKYLDSLRGLAEKILRVLCQTLEVSDDWVADFVETPIATLRLLHYPPQAPDASSLERGIGAHTDFGAVTILLQDMIGGLQVWGRETSQWTEAKPVRGAFVVNLGNLMMRWTNDEYLSNLHRVINKSGQERYSIPFFFAGNPDFAVKCFESCSGCAGAKYEPVTVGEWMSGRYADTYGSSKDKAVGELSAAEAASSTA